jgi:hypothetical protein
MKNIFLTLMIFGSFGVFAQTYSLSLKYLCDSEAWWVSNGYAVTKNQVYYHIADTNIDFVLDCKVAEGDEFYTYVCNTDPYKKHTFKFNKSDLTYNSKKGLYSEEQGQCFKPTITQRLQPIEQLVR